MPKEVGEMILELGLQESSEPVGRSKSEVHRAGGIGPGLPRRVEKESR